MGGKGVQHTRTKRVVNPDIGLDNGCRGSEWTAASSGAVGPVGRMHVAASNPGYEKTICTYWRGFLGCIFRNVVHYFHGGSAVGQHLRGSFRQPHLPIPCVAGLCKSTQKRTARGYQLGDGGLTPDSDGDNFEEERKRLNNLLNTEQNRLSGNELREIVLQKWGRRYEVRLAKRDSKVYLQVMWKFLEQKSFHLTEEGYNGQLDAVADLVTEWGLADMVRQSLKACKKNPVISQGGGAAVSIRLAMARDLPGF
eukprot:jgi/Mesvir1/8952/Mv20919-RA.1